MKNILTLNIVLVSLLTLTGCSHLSSKREIASTGNPEAEVVLDRVQNMTYNQSVGSYFSRSRDKGSLVKPSFLAANIDFKLSTTLKKGIVLGDYPFFVIQSDANNAFGSGLSIDVLKFMSLKLSDNFDPEEFKFYVVVSKKEGPLSGYRSHSNGLDITLIPLKKIDGVFTNVKNNPSEAEEFINSSINLLNQTGRVHSLFVPSWFRSAFEKPNVNFSVLAEPNLSSLQVRLVCNSQNVDCKSQGRLEDKW